MNLTVGNSDFSSTGLHAMTPSSCLLVETAGRDMQAALGIATDQFDGPGTHYVLAHDAAGRVSACARLMPTTRPYLLLQLYPQLFAACAAPCSADVWELSRFMASDFTGSTSAALPGLAPDVALTLLHRSIGYAKEQGALRVITLASVGFERLLRRAGLHVHRAGPPAIFDGHPVFACWIETGASAASVFVTQG